MAKKGSGAKVGKFFREVKAELKKVNWPKQKEVMSYTMVVIVTVLLVALFIGGIDFVFSSIIRPIILN
ncbi:preprotein translocase subunit SecE [Orenia marismortui]|uniref:Protein translocase subunit SecE n=1 Tax=Orenia marismortui TaxID=46469 RepID=A0A4R8GZ70_9FIRM|nr:preprotein translocase subunit SecE [Orenia marismortui]TDX49301.1 preprotein translocase subunit SecE [Orenia marismortui]